MTELARGRSQGGSLRVAVIARSPVVAAGLAALLEQAGISVAHHFGAHAGFSDSVSVPAATAAPDVVVVEVAPGASDPMDAAALAEFPGVAAVFLTDSAPDSAASPGSGVPTAWLRRDAGRDELAAAVHAVAAGLDVYDRALGGRAGAPPPISSQENGDGPEPLTPREIEVLQKLAGGLTNKAIAYDLGISEHTVKYHVGSILTKLDASGRTEAVAVGVRRGLIAL